MTVRNPVTRKIVGNIYRICEMPVNYVLGFRKRPEMGQDRQWMGSATHIRSRQHVLLVDKLDDITMGDEYYRAITEEGLYWIHAYDLVDVDHTTISSSV